MIYYDVTKMGGVGRKSGLTRSSTRLREEFGDAVTPVIWDGEAQGLRRPGTGEAIAVTPDDWFLTVELFSGAERPGFREFVHRRPCRLAALFYDAIPLRFPHVTWPQSVQRHPDYLKLLGRFDRVWAISEASRSDLVGFWRWQGVTPPAPVGVVELGADFDGTPRVIAGEPAPDGRPSLLCVGIIEPRKNQDFLLDVCESLWAEGFDFELHIVGRVNPHFGGPIERRMKRIQAIEPRLMYHAVAGDARLARLYAEARIVVFPTLAEGCGLPLLEALWHGVPCLCTDLPVLRENADGGGCLTAAAGDLVDWSEKLRALLTEASLVGSLRRAAAARTLPRWAGTAETLRSALT
ncbi:MAG TPA: glycosyltransferase [Lacunisphaera sp.]|nr:glycosyltransferase [Lacunisphaera sp.]